MAFATMSTKSTLLRVCALALLLVVPGAKSFQASPAKPLSLLLRAGDIQRGIQQRVADDRNMMHSSPSLLSMTSDSVGSSDNDLSASSASSAESTTSTTRVDTGALLRYAAAFCIQMGLFAGLFAGLDALVAALPIQKVPFAVNFFFFYACALKSRILNPLDNQRPLPSTKELKAGGDDDKDSAVDEPPPRKMPTWTPPGFVFPIVWLLIIGPLRAVSSCLVYQSTGHYATKAILTLMAHLSIGDIWNTINNKERRYGTSVVGVLMVWASAAAAAYQYYQVSPLAGRLLSLPLIWLTIASSLIVRTWQLNLDPQTGKAESLIPTTHADKSITKLEWFES